MDLMTTEERLKQLGEYIRANRLGLNLTQSTVAKRSGISLKAVRNIENGDNATMASFISVCRTLGKTDWMAALTPPSMTRSDIERYLRGNDEPRKRASGHV